MSLIEPPAFDGCIAAVDRPILNDAVIQDYDHAGRVLVDIYCGRGGGVTLLIPKEELAPYLFPDTGPAGDTPPRQSAPDRA